MPAAPTSRTPARPETNLRPSRALALFFRLLGNIWNGHELGWIPALFLAFAAWSYVGQLALPTAAAVLAVGAWKAHRRWSGAELTDGYRSWRWTAGLTVAVTGAVIGWSLSGGWWARGATALGLAAIEGLLWEPEQSRAWYSHASLVGILTRAGVLKEPRDGEQLPRLRYYGTPQVDSYGETITIGLDRPSVPAGDVIKARAKIAAAIPGARDDLVEIDHDPEQPATVVSIWKGKPQPKRDYTFRIPEGPVDYRQPLVLDVDKRGRQVLYRTAERHTMVVGATGSGKTVLGRWDASHALLDPTVTLYALIGKDDADDWDPMRPLCAEYVGGLSRAALARVEPVLTRLAELNESRAGMKRGSATLVKVIVEEWYALMGALETIDAPAAKRCRELYGQLLATARSRGILFLTLSQRGVVTHITSDQRTNMVQRLVGSVVDPADARYALGYTPDALPRGAGQFIYSDRDARGGLVQVPYLTDEAWLDVIDLAARLRDVDVPRETVSLRKPLPAPEPEPDPFELAVIVALEAGPLQAKDLLAELPAELRPSSPQSLGFDLRALVKSGLVAKVRVNDGKALGYALAGPRETTSEPSGAGPVPLVKTPAEDSRALAHAQKGTP